jgi:hypothetical protein
LSTDIKKLARKQGEFRLAVAIVPIILTAAWLPSFELIVEIQYRAIQESRHTLRILQDLVLILVLTLILVLFFVFVIVFFLVYVALGTCQLIARVGSLETPID